MFFLSLISCTQFQKKLEPGTPTKAIDSNKKFTKIPTEDLLKTIYQIWKSKDEKLIELELGKADNKRKVETSTIYSYNANLEVPYEQLIFIIDKNLKINSIYFEFIDENNISLNDQWILNNFKLKKWTTIELPQKMHTIVPKKILLNYEQNIQVGYIDGYKNNQLRFIYFGVIDDKKLDRFNWD